MASAKGKALDSASVAKTKAILMMKREMEGMTNDILVDKFDVTEEFGVVNCHALMRV